MNHDFLSAFVLLLLVLDPFGSLPIFISVLRTVDPARRTFVALRESAIAFGVLVVFMFGGQAFLDMMRLSERSLEVAGGLVLLTISMRMVFASGGEIYATDGKPREPFIFPLAVPLMAGPSAMATVLLLISRQPDRMTDWLAALSAAMAVCAVVLLTADRLRKLLGSSMISAMEKLMGLVLSAVAVEMILAGLKRYFFEA